MFIIIILSRGGWLRLLYQICYIIGCYVLKIGCRSLETLRNRNIGQMTLEQKLSQQSGGGLGLGVAAPPLINDNMEEDDSDSDSD